jgi:LysR family transcriptional regulator, cyn operon transcriptional activator
MDKAIFYILAIAEKKSISEAAKALYISQPSLSRYLSTLEKSLGVSLFQRTVEGTTLTEAGEQYVYYARAIQENYRALEKAMQEQRQGQSRSLRICTCLSAVTLTTQELIHAYEKKYAGATLRIRNSLSKDLPDLLTTGEYQFAVGPRPVNLSHFAYEKLFSEEYLLLVPSTFPPLPRKKSGNGALPVTRLADAAHLPFILQDSSTNVRKGLDRICKREKVRLENYSQVTSSVLVIRAVENQQGLGIVPSSFLPFATALHAFRCYEFTDQRSESGILYTPGKVFSSTEKYCISLIHSLLHREYEECQQLARETWER